jgi:hypothetical protein
MRTDANLAKIQETLASNCGDFFAACLEVGLSVQFVTQWQKDDPQVNAAIVEAQRLGSMRLESAAIRRAVHGIMEPVFYQGEVCGHKAVYSDGLLQTLLKGRMREVYGAEGDGARMVFNGPTQINNMPRAETYEQWLEMKNVTLAMRDDPKALPAPSAAAVAAFKIMSPPIDAEYAEVGAFKGVDL